MILRVHADDRAHFPFLIGRIDAGMGFRQSASVNGVPQVTVAIAHAGHQDHPVGLYDLGTFGRQALSNGGYPAILDQDIRILHFLHRWIHRQQIGAADKRRTWRTPGCSSDLHGIG